MIDAGRTAAEVDLRNAGGTVAPRGIRVAAGIHSQRQRRDGAQTLVDPLKLGIAGKLADKGRAVELIGVDRGAEGWGRGKGGLLPGQFESRAARRKLRIGAGPGAAAGRIGRDLLPGRTSRIGRGKDRLNTADSLLPGGVDIPAAERNGGL